MQKYKVTKLFFNTPVHIHGIPMLYTVAADENPIRPSKKDLNLTQTEHGILCDSDSETQLITWSVIASVIYDKSKPLADNSEVKPLSKKDKSLNFRDI